MIYERVPFVTRYARRQAIFPFFWKAKKPTSTGVELDMANMLGIRHAAD